MTETMEMDAMIEAEAIKAHRPRSHQRPRASASLARIGRRRICARMMRDPLASFFRAPARDPAAVTGTPIARAPDHLRPVEQIREDEPRLSPTPSVVD